MKLLLTNIKKVEYLTINKKILNCNIIFKKKINNKK